MHRNHPFANTRAMGYEPWLLRRLAWLACAGLLGLAMHLMQAPAPAAPGQGLADAIRVSAADPFTAMPGIAFDCSGAQSPASCGEVESSDGADKEIPAAPSLTLAAVQSLQPAWALDSTGLAEVRPLLRPPRRHG